MADVAEMTKEQTQSQAPDGRQEFTVDTTPLLSGIFGVEQPVRQEPAAQPVVTEQPKVEQPKVEEPKVETPPVVTTEWIKDFGWDSEETAKTEIKKLKEQTTQEVKFENEESK